MSSTSLGRRPASRNAIGTRRSQPTFGPPTTEVIGAIVDALSTLETDVDRDGP
jgi:hypothetical protein